MLEISSTFSEILPAHWFVFPGRAFVKLSRISSETHILGGLFLWVNRWIHHHHEHHLSISASQESEKISRSSDSIEYQGNFEWSLIVTEPADLDDAALARLSSSCVSYIINQKYPTTSFLCHRNDIPSHRPWLEMSRYFWFCLLFLLLVLPRDFAEFRAFLGRSDVLRQNYHGRSPFRFLSEFGNHFEYSNICSERPTFPNTQDKCLSFGSSFETSTK